jgi:hypothetical protein
MIVGPAQLFKALTNMQPLEELESRSIASLQRSDTSVREYIAVFGVLLTPGRIKNGQAHF